MRLSEEQDNKVRLLECPPFYYIVEYKDKENNGLRSVEGCTSPLHGEGGERYPRGPPIIMTLSTSG